jgi:hypothetical protein
MTARSEAVAVKMRQEYIAHAMTGSGMRQAKEPCT